MAGLFSSPKPPKSRPAPKTEDIAVQKAAAEAAARRRRSRGFRSTILSQDFLGGAPSGLKTQLGA